MYPLERTVSPQAVLDAIANQVAVLDPQGGIVLVNRAWNAFARANGLADLERVGPGVNYLAVAQRAARKGDALAGEAALGLAEVLAGKRGLFQQEYPCDSPDESRWFIMMVTPLGPPAQGAVASHLDITRRKLAEFQQQSLVESLQQALASIKTLQGLLRICSHCNKIQDETGAWQRLENYLESHSYSQMSHGLCPECVRKYYSDPEEGGSGG